MKNSCILQFYKIKLMKRFFLYQLVISCVTITALSGCRKPDSSNNNPPQNASPADKIQGAFDGTGKYLPANINLGNTLICVSPSKDYTTLYQTGAATMNVTKLTDSTVKVEFLSGPFPIAGYPQVKVKLNGNVVEFLQGSYDINSKAIVFSAVAPNFSYSYSANCKIGLPYYTSTIAPGPTGLMEYINLTIKRYEFGGQKQQ
jgi:hypothetical protein